MCLFSARPDLLDLIDYSESNGPVENVGGDNANDDIDAYNVDYFQPITNKHSHLRPENPEMISPEGTIPPNATTIGISLNLVVFQLKYQSYKGIGY